MKTQAQKQASKQAKKSKAATVVKKAVKVAKDAFIKLTAKTWNADLTQTLVAFAWVHNKVRADINERLAEYDASNYKVGKRASLLVTGHNGEIARDIELDTTGKFARIINYARGGVETGWFNLAEVETMLAGATFKLFANADALARTLTHAEQRKAMGGDSYACIMSNDLTKKYYAACVRKLASGRLISWHEENKRNAYNAHEVSATEKELARKAVLKN